MSRPPQRLELTWYNKDKALIPTETGKYGYTWVDPSDPRYCETHTLVMAEYVRGVQSPKSDQFEYSERADLKPQEDNLLILGESGDVLEALTRVPELAEKYVGQVKLIYIDPPFNTAQTFASYEDNLEHSVWLTMMRDRLLHMKKLLSDDGSIWVHLDDVEVHRMRLLLDEVFGADSFQAQIVWQKADGPRNNSEGFSSDQDVIWVYSRTSAFQVNRLDRSDADNARFSNPDGDPRGPWFDDNPFAAHAISKRQHPGIYGIQHPITGQMIYPPHSSNWRYAQDTMFEIMSKWGEYEYGEVTETELSERRRRVLENTELRSEIKPLVLKNFNEESVAFARSVYERGNWPDYILRSGGTGGFGRKAFIPDRGLVPQTWWSNDQVGHNRAAKTEIKALFPGITPFSTPKPERLLERIIHIGSNPGDIVLDVFAGSGTTAAVAQKMGRRWVTCELLESTFTTFTRSRLEKVINDQDPGGITRSKGERVAADNVELPDGVTPEDAAKFTSVLNKLIADDPEAKKDPRVKALKAAAKTQRTKDVINWRGGGGFQVAHLGPQCFDYSERLGQVVLTEAATGDALIESVAANLGFELLHPDDDTLFHAKRGRMLLKVHEGIADVENVSVWLSNLQEGETLLIAATGVADGVSKFLRQHARGSRVIAIPEDIFRYTHEDETEEA